MFKIFELEGFNLKANKTIVILAIAIVVVAVIVAAVVIINEKNNGDRTATFDQNYDGSENIVITVKNGTLITAPATERTGYYTVGWYLDRDCTQKAEFPYKMTANTTFYEKWTDKAAGYLYNIDYLTDSPKGQALCYSSQYTTGAEIAKIDGNEFNSKAVTYGGSLLVADLDAGDMLLSVIDLEDFKILFKIPYQPLSVKVVTLDQFVCQFIIAQYYGGYYVYDLNGNVYGPTTTAPQIVLSDTLLFKGVFYRYDSDGKVYSSFDQTNKTVIPEGGNGKTFYQIEKFTTFDDTYDFALNILNDKFEVIDTLKFADKAKLGTCVTLANGGYFVQYGVAGTSSERFVVNVDGVTYVMYSYIIDRDFNVTEQIFNKYIESSADKMNSPSVNWDLYANDAVSLAYIRSGHSHGYTLDLVLFSTNGKSITYADQILTDSTSTMPMATPGYYRVVIQRYLAENAEISVVNGNDPIIKVAVPNILNPNGQKYFVFKVADESSRFNFNIYDVTGTVVGSFSGYTYFGSSHNDLFFEKDGNTYVFKDGAMSKLCDGTDVSVYDWGYSYTETYDDGGVMKTRYVFCTENGTIISKSANNYAGEYLTNDGEYIININTTSDEYRLYKLTV